VLATTGPTGCDASPRGGPTGFVRVLDPHRLAWGDLAGNNRLDSASNLVAHPAVGLLFLVPGVDETLRVNGRATLTTDPDILDRCVVEGRRPRVAVGVDVDECYLHCAKAFRRSGLWHPDAWLPEPERPSAACILRDQLRLDVEPAVVEQALERDYVATLWESGGA
jgi:PPOX class probable FMN-dependent enzyme